MQKSMEETATPPTTARVPRYDLCDRPSIGLSLLLLSPSVAELLLGLVYPTAIMAGLAMGGLLFLDLLRIAHKPIDPHLGIFRVVIWGLFWAQIQPRELSVWPRTLVGLQCAFSVAFIYMWLCYLCRETVARRAAANKPIKVTT